MSTCPESIRALHQAQAADTRSFGTWQLAVCLLAAMLVPGRDAVAQNASAAAPSFRTPEHVAITIHEWVVPWPETRPRDPSVGADGRVWFVGQTGDYLAVFDARSGVFQRFELPAGTRPHSVRVSPKGEPWVAGNGNGTLLRFSAQGELQETVQVPAPAGERPRDPHTLAFDGRGGLWFTMQQSNTIGHLSANGQLRQVTVPTDQARPYGIVADSSGNAWVALFGAAKLAKVMRRNMQLREYDLPRNLARPRRLALDARGSVWYVDYAGDYLGRVSGRRGRVQEWPLLLRPAAPYALVADAKGRLWFFYTARQPNLLRGFDPREEEFLDATPIPSGGITVRHAEYHKPSQSIWFGTDANTLGRAVLPK